MPIKGKKIKGKRVGGWCSFFYSFLLMSVKSHGWRAMILS